MRIKTIWSVTIRATQDWWGDNCLRLAASLAYYTALLPGAPVAAPRRPDRDGARTGTGGRSARHPARKPHGPGWPRTRQQHSYHHQSGGGHLGDRRRPRHPGHWRHGGLRRAPGDDEPHLGGPARPDQRGLGRDLGLAQGARLLAGPLFALAFLLVVSLVISAALAGASALFRVRSRRPQPPPGNRRLAGGPHPRIFLAFLTTCRTPRSLARRVAGRIRHRGLFTLGKTGDRLLPRPGQRRLGLRGGRVDGGAPRVGLLLGPDRVLRRRVHAGLGHAPGRRGPPAARRVRGGAQDEGRGGRRAYRGGISACPVEHGAVRCKPSDLLCGSRCRSTIPASQRGDRRCPRAARPRDEYTDPWDGLQADAIVATEGKKSDAGDDNHIDVARRGNYLGAMDHILDRGGQDASRSCRICSRLGAMVDWPDRFLAGVTLVASW